MPGRDPTPNPVGNVQLKYLTFNCWGEDTFLEWRCFCSEVWNIFFGHYAAVEEKQKAALALNWFGHDGSELGNSWEMVKNNTVKVSLKTYVIP